MRKLLCRIWVISLILASLFSIRAAASLPAAEQTRLESAPGENRQQQDQGATREDFKIKVDVNLVTADVTAIGAAAPELHAEDFTVYDNDIAQQVSHFSRDQIPLAVAVLIDGTESIRAFLPVLQIAAVSALRRLKPEDQVALFSFYANPVKLSDLTEDRLLIAEKMGRLKSKFLRSSSMMREATGWAANSSGWISLKKWYLVPFFHPGPKAPLTNAGDFSMMPPHAAATGPRQASCSAGLRNAKERS